MMLAPAAASAAAIGLASRRAQARTEESRAPMLGIMGAFVFAAQMVNFPVGAGTTGHLLGAALMAITLGPSAAMVVMTAILIIQALIFQDGGVLALGANVFNMAVAGVGAAWLPYRLLGGGRMRDAGVFLAGFLSVLVTAALALGELAASGTAVPRPLAVLSLGLFSVNGLLEGLITLGVVKALGRMNAAWVARPERLNSRTAAVLLGSAVALATAGLLAASAAPDTLESLAQQMGIADRGRPLFETPFSDYAAAFIRGRWLSQAAAGLFGTALAFLLIYVAAKVRSRRKGA